MTLPPSPFTMTGNLAAIGFIASWVLAWGIGGWLLFPFLQKIGPAAAQALRERVAAELKTSSEALSILKERAGKLLRAKS